MLIRSRCAIDGSYFDFDYQVRECNLQSPYLTALVGGCRSLSAIHAVAVAQSAVQPPCLTVAAWPDLRGLALHFD